jgi:hypothetical protein
MPGQRRRQSERSAPQPPPRVSPFWSWRRSDRSSAGGSSGADEAEAGAEAKPEFTVRRTDASAADDRPPRPDRNSKATNGPNDIVIPRAQRPEDNPDIQKPAAE